MLTSIQHLAFLSDIGKLDSSYIVVWPNGVWCHPEELEQFGHLSDDAQRWFYQTNVYNDDELETAATMLCAGCSAAYVHYILQRNRKTLLNFFRRKPCSSGA